MLLSGGLSSLEVGIFEELVQLLSPYDVADLLAAIGGLHLMPENANQAIRLEALAHAAASIADRNSKPIISGHRLKVIADTKLPEGVYLAEDPCETPVTETLTFVGGSYVVFPGGFEESTFIVRHLASALFLHSERIPNVSFLSHARRVLGGVLAVSDEVARRAGLKRHIPPGDERRQVIVPDAETLSALKRCVVFDLDEFGTFLRNRGLPPSCLDRLIIDAGGSAIGSYEIGNSTLLIRPIVRVGSKLIVTMPSALLVAAKHEILRAASEQGVLNHVADRYSDAVWNTVLDSLDYLHNHPIGAPASAPPIVGSKEAFFSLDADKLLYTMLITDPLEHYAFDELSGDWRLADLAQKIEARVDEVANDLLRQTSGLNAILTLILIQGVGRSHMFASEKKCDAVCFPMIGMTAADLETVSFLEAGDPLFLWKFGCASTAIRDKTMIRAFGVLDEIHLYRKWGYSYCGSDEERPGAIFIAPGTGTRELRQEVLRTRDWHALNSYKSGFVVEVTCLHSTASIPIYVPLRNIGKRVELVLESLATPIWIVGPEYGRERDRVYHSLYAEIAGMIAYWLWQLSPSLDPVLRSQLAGKGHIVMWLEVVQDEAWFKASPPTSASSKPIKWSVDRSTFSITLTIGPQMSRRFEGPDNTGEREFMTEVLKTLRELVGSTELSDVQILEMLNVHAPLGIKKMLCAVSTGRSPDYDPRGLPPSRGLQEADENAQLDELGQSLINSEGMKRGPIPDEKRLEVLNKAVTFFYEELRAFVSSLSPHGLLDFLISQHERITHDSAIHGLNLPGRLPVWGETPEMLSRIQEEISDQAGIAVASRFLIEYVAARPPLGIRPISLSVYDRLTALATRIVTFGGESDIIHYELADIKFSILPSERLGAKRQQIAAAMEMYRQVFTSGTISRATSAFKDNWRLAGTPGSKPPLVERIDKAAEREFGHTVTELRDFMSEAINLGITKDSSGCCLPLKEFVKQLAKELSWSVDKTESVFDLLSLQPRADYLTPPPPFAKHDVYPWRFNRELSYLRRPFICRERNGVTEVLWGFRHVYTCMQYLTRLIFDGKLKARTTEMRELLGEIKNEEGKEFNDHVARLFEANRNLVVRRRVQKIGSRLLLGPTGSLGDIDVLVGAQSTNTLSVIECKSLGNAHTPYEMWGEIQKLFYGEAGKKSILQKHQARVEWVTEHLGEVLGWLKLDEHKNWKVSSMIVTDRELITPYLRQCPVRVVPVRELRKELETTS